MANAKHAITAKKIRSVACLGLVSVLDLHILVDPGLNAAVHVR